MKKYILLLAALLGMTGSMAAQTDSPNRMLVIDQSGQYKGFNANNVNRVEFATVEGEVAANVEILSSSRTELTVNVTRTPQCSSFLFDIIPAVMARQLETYPSSSVSSYMERTGAQTYYEDFPGGKVSGFELDYNTEYAVATLGIDRYGVPCDFRAAYFTTEKAPIVGNPMVNVEVVNAGLRTLDLHFTPNADTKEYYFCIFDEGEAQQQFDMFGPMFGFSSMGQMIMQVSGNAYVGEEDFNYTGMEPNTKYELYVQPLDINGNMAELQVFSMQTLSQGGSGDATVEILIGDYKLTDWYGEMLPSQFITFTPNDQTWCYRFGVYTAEQYDADPEGIQQYVASEPPMPNMANWFFYETMTTDYQIDPNTPVVVVAAAKNADNVWGTINVVRHTTPAAVSGAPAMHKAPALGGLDKIKTRLTPAVRSKNPGRVPVLNKFILNK